MPTDVAFDWDEWNINWAADLDKNEMWAKIRSGENDPVSGEPLPRYPECARDVVVEEPAPPAPRAKKQ